MKQYVFLSGAFLSAAFLAACGRGGLSPSSLIVPTSGAPLSTDRADVETVLHSFTGGTDGASPSEIVAVNGTLYGTTTLGGGSTCAEYGQPQGCGTIFAVDLSGADYRVLHRYPNNARRGSAPNSGVIYADGVLYGTTEWGGSTKECALGNAGCGTVFKVDPSGKKYTTLYKFNQPEGFAIIPSVVYDKGTLYGGTAEGGDDKCDCGVLYALSPNGNETILHSFAGAPAADGNEVFFAPIEVKGTLYGTTSFGGDAKCFEPFYAGCGTIYTISKSGKHYHILYRFKSGKDGSIANNVVDVNGTLYGTTLDYGGTSCTSPLGYGCGIIFKIGTSGSGYQVLYRFKGGSDGFVPTGLSAGADGMLYGATTYGGNSGCYSGYGCGIVFRIKTSGAGYRVLYRFKGGADGSNPFFYGPIDVNGTLYGTTDAGGGSGCGGSGCGTVFAVTQRL